MRTKNVENYSGWTTGGSRNEEKRNMDIYHTCKNSTVKAVWMHTGENSEDDANQKASQEVGVEDRG